MRLQILICMFAIFVSSFCAFNESSAYLEMDKSAFTGKSQKWLSFNTNDNDIVSVELAFNVPFLSIPIKKSLDMAKGGLANINIGAVLLTGVIVIAGSIAAPAIFHLIAKNIIPVQQTSKSDSGDMWMEITSKLNKVFTENNVDSISCFQRITCWTVKNSAMKVSMGTAASRDKIIDAIATNDWFHMMIKDTIIYPAIKHGLSGINCSKEYAKCRINNRNIQTFIEDFVNKIYL